MVEYSLTLNPRIADLNYGRHVGHTELINLMHEVRVQFLKQYGLNEIDLKGNVLIMRQLNVTYFNQIFWDNELKFDMQVDVRGAKIIFDYLIYNASLHNKAAAAEAIMVLIDIHTQKPVKPDWFIKLFAMTK